MKAGLGAGGRRVAEGREEDLERTGMEKGWVTEIGIMIEKREEKEEMIGGTREGTEGKEGMTEEMREGVETIDGMTNGMIEGAREDVEMIVRGGMIEKRGIEGL